MLKAVAAFARKNTITKIIQFKNRTLMYHTDHA